MLLRKTYYAIKPHMPKRLRIAFRKKLARIQFAKSASFWPIDQESAGRPEGWNGWPEGKQFALVLTHDVESAEGVAKARQLAEIEMKHGFRSSFNFVPRGYDTPVELRKWLIQNGFEVGVHDLYHDGKLFASEKSFAKSASAINQYLKEWSAVGFRSGFMLRELDWLGALDIEYDCSTFDTDPFEPQPQGVRTIFPFTLEFPGGKSIVELPYTLAQDSTLFLLLTERTIDTWTRKLKWISVNQGMALMNVHPDYIDFNNRSDFDHYPVDYYESFLKHVKANFPGQYWSALPREVAAHVRHGGHGAKQAPSVDSAPRQPRSRRPSRVWIDLDNTPHIPFFEPIIKELEARGHEVLLTARDAYQVCEMADLKGWRYTTIGKHYGKNAVLKLMGTVFRSLQLARWMLQNKPDIGLSHGSRAQIVLCNCFRLPSILIMDYEHAAHLPLMRPRWEIIPEVISAEMTCIDTKRVRKYPGIKEDVYAPFLKPDHSLRSKLGASPEDILVVVRPPATEAHYHNAESEVLFADFMERVIRIPSARVILLPRNKRQTAWIKGSWPHWFSNTRVLVPETVIDGMNLLWHADLVVSGGGTMNREAAALGTPVYSIFRGPIGAVDRQLSADGRLVMIESRQHVNSKIRIEKRAKELASSTNQSRALNSILGHVEEIIGIEYPRK